MVVMARTKIRSLLLLVCSCLLASCSDKNDGNTEESEQAPSRDVEVDVKSETLDDEPPSLSISDDLGTEVSSPAFGTLPTSSYSAAFEYLDNAGKELRDLSWVELKEAAGYLLDQRASLLSHDSLGNLTVSGKITDTLTVEFAVRVAKGEVDIDEVRSILHTYEKRPYDTEKLANILEDEYGDSVKLSGSEMARYKKIYDYAFEASGGEEGIFADVEDSFNAAWFIDGKRAVISLLHIYESHKRVRALDALLKYISRGGNLNLDANEFRKSIYEIVPDSFEEDTFPEFNGTGNLTRLHPSIVYRLIPRD